MRNVAKYFNLYEYLKCKQVCKKWNKLFTLHNLHLEDVYFGTCLEYMCSYGGYYNDLSKQIPLELIMQILRQKKILYYATLTTEQINL